MRPKRERAPLGAGSRAAPRLWWAGAPRRVLSLSRIEGTHTLHHAGYGLAAAASSDPTQGSYDARLRSARVCCSQLGYTRDQHRFAGRRSGRAAGCSSHEGAGRAADNFILQTGCSYAAIVCSRTPSDAGPAAAVQSHDGRGQDAQIRAQEPRVQGPGRTGKGAGAAAQQQQQDLDSRSRHPPLREGAGDFQLDEQDV